MPTKCALCSAPYKDPSSIPCGHIFCFPCLQSHIAQTSQDGYDAKCPTCQTDFPFSTPDANLVMKPLQKHLHAGIRRVHVDIDIDGTLALDLAEAKTALTKLRNTLAESQTVLAAKEAALEDIATQLGNIARKADDLQAQLNTEKESTKKQKAHHDTVVRHSLYLRKEADELQAKLKIDKEVTEKQRVELETLRTRQVKLESSRSISIPLPTAFLVAPKPPAMASTRSYDLPTVLTAASTTPKRPCPTLIAVDGGGGPAKRSRIDSPLALRALARPGGEKE